jgi:hypothetical protein
MAYKRQNVNGTTPQDLKAMNDNFQYLFLKVFGDVSMSDIAGDVKDMLYTNWLQPQGEGNLDSLNPLYVRFYIPPTTKRIKSAKLNLIIDRYKIDSDVATSKDITIRTATIANATIDLTTTQSNQQVTKTTPVDVQSYHHHQIFQRANDTPDHALTDKYFTFNDGGIIYYMKITTDFDGQAFTSYDDENYTATPGGHYHTIKIDGHAHSITMPQHTHAITLEIDGHEHDLNFGIKRASAAPQNVKMFINGTDTEKVFSGDMQTLNDFDMSGFLKIGEWNEIKFTTTNLARVTAYGIVELLQSYK